LRRLESIGTATSRSEIMNPSLVNIGASISEKFWKFVCVDVIWNCTYGAIDCEIKTFPFTLTCMEEFDIG
jgi:hypothetical protein